MNILVKYSNSYISEYLGVLTQELDNTVFFANTTEEAIHILNEKKIDKVFLELSYLEEVNFIEYVNKYFPTISVLVTTNSYNENLLEAIRNGIFAIIKKPLNLKTILSNII